MTGSSDCASTLLALNRLWKLGLTRTQLSVIGLRLGADVPFFLFGRNAWVEGVGEQITPIDLPPARFVVVQPDQGLETARIFCAPELRRDTRPATISGFAALGPEQIFEFGRNDLQPVAQALQAQIGVGLNWLAERGLQGRMTGSGSAIFAPLPLGGGAQLGTSKPADGWTARVCSTLQVHPLADW